MSSLVSARNLTKVYAAGKKKWVAVDGVDLEIAAGETLGLVGESGCGKSTLGRMLLGLVPPTAGQIFFERKEITGKRDRALCREMQMIFQDPYASLNPRMSVGEIIREPLKIHRLPDRVDELLDLVGLPRFAKSRFPHEFSGGQRQRVGIARALALNPKFIVCDEPISALDLSIQAQIVNLLIRLQKELQLTYLFIAHDLAMVRYLSNQIAVMYLGKIVEMGPTEEIFANPLHPYTQLLLSSIPCPDPRRKKERIAMPSGELSLPPAKGCPFAHRCPLAQPLCKETKPELLSLSPQRAVACHLHPKKEILKDLLTSRLSLLRE